MKTQSSVTKSQVTAPTRTKTPTTILAVSSLACLLAIGGLLMWQYKITNPRHQSGPPMKEQQEVMASKVKLETLTSGDERVKNALLATDLSKAKQLIDKRGAFVGTVTGVRSSLNNNKVVLDFAAQRETATRAIIILPNFHKFPKLSELVGKKVLVSGIFAPHEGRAEIELTEPKQLQIVGS